ncbi:MAG: hypothetical protein N2169_00590 [bacterium]|nr:hypothetical protein [bacterium]
MSKGMVNMATMIFISLFIIFTFLAFANTLNRFSNFDRFYIFWQGMYLGDSFIVKLYTNQTAGDLVVRSVPYENIPANVKEIGKAYLDSSNSIVVSTNPYKYQTKIYIQYSGEVQKYRIIYKYVE